MLPWQPYLGAVSIVLFDGDIFQVYLLEHSTAEVHTKIVFLCKLQSADLAPLAASRQHHRRPRPWHSTAAVAYSTISYSQRLAISIGTLLSHSLAIGMHLLQLRQRFA